MTNKVVLQEFVATSPRVNSDRPWSVDRLVEELEGSGYTVYKSDAATVGLPTKLIVQSELDQPVKRDFANAARNAGLNNVYAPSNAYIRAALR